MKTLIDENHIVVDKIAKDWIEAVKIAGKPLVDDGYIEEEYIEDMIKNVEKNGPYMVLTDYFALLHARPGKHVNKIGMSLYVSDKLIDFKGKDVKIFLVLASTDNDSHIEYLKRIVEIFSNSDSFKIILNGNKEEILEELKKGSE